MKDAILTIDVEGPRGHDPVLYQIWGKTVNGEYYGISKIMDICDSFQVKGLFFVDIPEIWDYGYEKIKEVILSIRKRDHDVGVHIHPHHMPNETRHFLFDYTKEEQYSIIKKCTDKYYEITGEVPKSFRAGKYGANVDTLDIINELGYKYDFSEFYSQKWCGIKPEVAYVLPQKYKNLIEFPVTIFRSFKFSSIYQRFDKIEAVDCPKEMCHILDLYAKSPNKEVIILFLHSFSFINFLENPDNPTINKRAIEHFKTILKYGDESKHLRFIAEKDLEYVDVPQRDAKENIVTTKGFIRQFKYFLIRAWSIRKSNNKVKLAISILYGVITLFVIFLIVALVR